MTSYPKTVNKFIPWTKAMVAGATVDKPSYSTTNGKKARNRRKRVSRKKKRNAKKD